MTCDGYMISLAIMTQTPDGATDVVETRRDRGRLPLFIEIDTVLHRLLILAVMTTGAALHAEDWLRFRGPNGSGIAAGSVIERPSFEDNLIWKTDLPAGHSSPVIAGARIYLTAVEDEKLFTLALDRSTGRILWRRQAPRPRVSQLQENNNAASPTAASDGENAYVFFGDFGLLSYGADGNERWRIPLGPFRTIRGMAASPIVADGKVFLVCDADGGDSFLIAADAETGREVWRADRSEFRRAFSTPAVHRPIDGPAELIVPGAYTLTSYAVESGEELWRVGGLCWQPKAVPLIAGGRVYLNCQGAGTDPNAGRYPEFAKRWSPLTPTATACSRPKSSIPTRPAASRLGSQPRRPDGRRGVGLLPGAHGHPARLLRRATRRPRRHQPYAPRVGPGPADGQCAVTVAL